MQPRRVLVTGVSRPLGSRLAHLLSADPDIAEVVGVDTVRPQADLGRTEFVRADIRNPMIAKVITNNDIDTVVHLNVVAMPFAVGGRTAMKEINVLGTMQLLAACQKSPAIRKFVLKSTTAVYGASPRDPALFTEDMRPRELPSSGYSKDAVEVEGYVRGFARRRPDVDVTTLRFANFIGPHIDSPFTRYFRLPVIPTMFGHDPRLQFCHEDDAVEVLRLAATEDRRGTYNVSGSGVLLLSQAIRRSGRPSVPVFGPLATALGQALRRAGVADFTPDQLALLQHGRVADTTALRERFGYQPKWTTAGAFDDFLSYAGRGPVLELVRRV